MDGSVWHAGGVKNKGALQWIALRSMAAMCGFVAALSVIVVVLALIAWGRGGENADGMPQLATGFSIGAVVLAVLAYFFMRRLKALEASLDAQADSDPSTDATQQP